MAAALISDRSAMTGWIEATPSMTASRITSSSLSPFKTLSTSVMLTSSSGAGSSGCSVRTAADRFPASTISARHMPPRPSNTSTSSPTPNRSTRTRCSASSSGNSMRAAVASTPGTWKRGRTRRVYSCALMFFRGQTVGKYRILSPLGSGGFGSVYLAEDTWIDKKVAIKVPHRQNLDFGELVHEPRLLASLNHPNIVTVLTAEKQDDVFFIVMEYVQGDTLEALIERDGVLDLTRALDYTCQIANAMDHAHKQGIIHRDLRPGNVLVTDQGMCKVADFGTSRFLEIAAHGTTVIGSPPYMAPEQFQGKAVFASDIYSLGVTMYQMLTGDLPYQTPAPADLERLMRGDLVTAPRLRNP